MIKVECSVPVYISDEIKKDEYEMKIYSTGHEYFVNICIDKKCAMVKAQDIITAVKNCTYIARFS